MTESLDLLLALKQLALIVVFFTDNYTHLVLHVAELETLLLELSLDLDQLFGLLVQLALHLIEITIQHSN